MLKTPIILRDPRTFEPCPNGVTCHEPEESETLLAFALDSFGFALLLCVLFALYYITPA